MRLEQAHDEISDIMPEERVLTNQLMAEYTTFKTGGNVDLMILPASVSQMKNAIRLLYAYEVPYVIMGKGSNMIVGDKGIRGAVIKLAGGMDEIEVDGEYIKAEAGVTNYSLVKKGHENGLTGLEFLSGIPGSIGGSVVMNAGAYGGEIKQYLEEVDILDSDFKVKTLKAADLDLRYRFSNIQKTNKYITRAVFRLNKGNVDEAKVTLSDLVERRKDKQPLQFPSAGSIFKRPVGHYAGALIEKAGLKGHMIGGAQVSDKHAGFIINTGNATSKDIVTLIQFIQESVYTQEGVKLETEVKMIGEF